jgi:DNA-binding transcriptional ArsR family regulator
MSDAGKLAQIAALVGDPARANMLVGLLDGRALTAGELAYTARVTPQTASEHLGKLVDAGVLAPANRQGRHRYYRLASPQVASMLEGIMVVAGSAPPGPRLSSWRGGETLRNARTCYDHLAGRLGVGIADALRGRGHLVLDQDGGEVTPSGIAFLRGLGMDVQPVRGRPFCRPCLDWSERRQHLAGHIGAVIACRCFALGWVARQPGGRAVLVTAAGTVGFAEHFGLTLPDGGQATPARAA